MTVNFTELSEGNSVELGSDNFGLDIIFRLDSQDK